MALDLPPVGSADHGFLHRPGGPGESTPGLAVDRVVPADGDPAHELDDRGFEPEPECEHTFGRGELHHILWALDGEELEIETSVADWLGWFPVVAVGDRPRDHMTRDLMHGSLLRDHRVPAFARMAKDPPPDWLREAVAHLPVPQQPQARQHLTLRWMVGRGLFHLSESLPEYQQNEGVRRLIRDVMQCRPLGAHVGRPDRDDWSWRSKDGTCKRRQLCPSCLTRWAMKYYRRLRLGPCNPGRGAGKHLLLARIEVPGEALPPLSEAVCMDLYRWNPPWICEGSTFNPRRLLRLGDILFARTVWGGRLRDWARSCGATGGVLVHQVGPGRTERGLAGFVHELSILAEVPTATRDHRIVLKQRACLDSERMPTKWSGDVPIRIAAAVMAADRPTALRYLWAGTSVGFDLERAGIHVNGGIEAAWGLEGAVRLQPWFLYDAEQWLSHGEALKGLHLARPFGSWRGKIPPLPRRVPGSCDRMVAGPKVIARRARRRGLDDRNDRVAAEALAVRQRFLEVARPIHEGLAREGRRPGRGRLMAALAAAGHPVSERVARDLILEFDRQSERRGS